MLSQIQPRRAIAGIAVFRRRDYFLRLFDMETQQNAVPLPGYEGLSFEKVWAMFQETDKKFQETDRKFQETDRRFR
ncbi:MAG: hypothetical protein LBG26_02785, partial [Treponema sp.]|nr:hypothetical protein [Treponema sp.]